MTKKNKYIVDEIIHKYDSKENSYFLFGSITGEIDNNGKDLLEPTVTLVIPKSKISVIFNQLRRRRYQNLITAVRCATRARCDKK